MTDPHDTFGRDLMQRYVAEFNQTDEELYTNDIDNSAAADFLEQNIPLFECPDPEFERTYYFRWWSYRKHIRSTRDGYVITEFLPDVSWAGKHNTISCPAGHHFMEGRWLRDPRYLDDYARFWLTPEASPRLYSFWIAHAYLQRHQVTPNTSLLTGLLDGLIENYEAWERSHKGEHELFHQVDDRDGMECSIGGSGFRATINAYMYGDAVAISQIAKMADREDVQQRFIDKAKQIKQAVLDYLWDERDQFFKVVSVPDREMASVRELHGYTPWYTDMIDVGGTYDAAWQQLMDKQGFFAPFGPTTAEQRHPGFQADYTGHDCQWNGSSWPFATAITLTALANHLNRDGAKGITKSDYFNLLNIYTRSQRRQRADGRVIPWIDENQHPYTGTWLARQKHIEQREEGELRNGQPRERGKDYNHSTYCDLIITGLVGLRPRMDDVIEVNPLLPSGAWEYLRLSNIRYHGRDVTITWDRTGNRYGRAGLCVTVDGQVIAHTTTLSRLTARLPG